MGDGKFGAAYAQEDGVAFKEESTGNNERIGEENDHWKDELKTLIGFPNFRTIQLHRRERQQHCGQVLRRSEWVQVSSLFHYG